MERNETLDVICERIKALEEEVRAQKVQNKRLRVVIAALVVLAALPYLLAAGMYTQTFSVLRVERIEFVEEGELMAAIEGGKTLGPGSGLGIYDKNGKLVVAIGFLTGGPVAGSRGIYLLDKKEKPVIALMALPDGSTAVCVLNNEGKIVANLGTPGELLPIAERGNGCLEIFNRYGEYGVAITGEDTGGRIQIIRSHRVGNPKVAAVAIGVTKKGSGLIGVYNRSGSLIWGTPLR